MTAAERRKVASAVAANQRKIDARKRRQKADEAYRRVLEQTGDETRARKVRASVAREQMQVASLTARAARAGRLPSPSLIDPQVRDQLQQAGIVPKIPSGGVIAKAGSNILESAVYAPAGAYEAGKAVALDVRDTALLHPTAKRTAAFGKAVAKSTAETVKHPLRRPGDTLLLGLGAAGAAGSVASRIGAAGRAAAAGEGLARALVRSPSEGGSLLRAPLPPVREIRSGDLTVRVRASKNVPTRLVQRAYDKATGQKPPTHRVAREVAAKRKVSDAVERSVPASLISAGKRLTTPQQMALRVVHEGVDINTAVARHREWAKTAKGRARRDLNRRAALLEAARAYVTVENGVPVIRRNAPRPLVGGKVVPRRGVNAVNLSRLDQAISRVAGDAPGGREALLREMGLLTGEQIMFRRQAPGRLLKGAEYVSGEDAARAVASAERAAAVEQRSLVREGNQAVKGRSRSARIVRGWADRAERQAFEVGTRRSSDEAALIAVSRPLDAAASVASRGRRTLRGEIDAGDARRNRLQT